MKSKAYTIVFFILAVISAEALFVVNAVPIEENEPFQLLLTGFIFRAAVFVLIASMVLTMIFGIKRFKEKASVSPRQAVIDAKALPVFAFSLLAGILFVFLGKRLAGRFPMPENFLIGVFLAALILPGALAAVSFMTAKRFGESLGEGSKRAAAPDTDPEKAKRIAEQSIKSLRTVRLLTALFCVFLIFSGILIAFVPGLLEVSFAYVVCALLSACFFTAALIRLLPLNMKNEYLDDPKVFVSRSDFPRLYAIAEEAAEAAGFKELVGVALTPMKDLKIVRKGKAISVLIPCYTLAQLSETELGLLMRRGFACALPYEGDAEIEYNRSLSLKPDNLLKNASDIFFSLPDAVWKETYSRAGFALNLLKEEAADRAMLASDAMGSSKAAAASALAKTAWLEIFSRDMTVREGKNIYRHEEIPKTPGTDSAELLSSSAEKRSAFWNGLIMKELTAEDAEGPTLGTRIRALGVEEITALPFGGSEEYKAEAGGTLKRIDELAYNSAFRSYARDRQENYLKYKEIVDKWRAEGEPVEAGSYRRIGDAFAKLYMVSEADALCRRAIEELPEHSCGFAYYLLGQSALMRFDDAGIEYLYRSANNMISLPNALREIREYCLKTGNAAELERFREVSPGLYEKRRRFEKAGEKIARSDSMSPAELPEGADEVLAAHIRAVSRGDLESVWVARKTGEDGYSANVLGLRFARGTRRERIVELTRSIVLYASDVLGEDFLVFECSGPKTRIEKLPGREIFGKRGIRD